MNAIYCAECRCGPHFVSHHCSCCEDCHAASCVCGLPARGRKLTKAELRGIERDTEDRDHNSGAPFWTERVGALLDHIGILEAELQQARKPLLTAQPMLPGIVVHSKL